MTTMPQARAVVGSECAPQQLIDPALQNSVESAERTLSLFEDTLARHPPVLDSLLLQIPTDTILALYHTSHSLRYCLQKWPAAWKSLSFRLYCPPTIPPGPSFTFNPASRPIQRQSRAYALDQLLLQVALPFTQRLKSLELDNTGVSGQILISTVLHLRRETLEHLSVRGCKNVSLRYHIVPYLTMFGLQHDVDTEKNIRSASASMKLALKSLYVYRCRHHRRRPYLAASLERKDSDSEPTHDLVTICHKLGIWTDTAWCTTPAGRCLRRSGYVSMRVPHGSPQVWVVFDRLWRCRNWIGPVDPKADPSHVSEGKLWESCDKGYHGEALGVGNGEDLGEGKMVAAHLRQSHLLFVHNVKCSVCLVEISERCEQCSILMHCVGCRRTLCASCAYDRPYLYQGLAAAHPESNADNHQNGPNSLWWAPGAVISPNSMYDPETIHNMNSIPLPGQHVPQPELNFRWCCTEPIFSGGGGISIGTSGPDVDQLRAAPLPRGQGWEVLNSITTEGSEAFSHPDHGLPTGEDLSEETRRLAMMRWLLESFNQRVSPCPRNLCLECYESPKWRVPCKICATPLCIKHDVCGLRLRVCGFGDLRNEKKAMQTQQSVNPAHHSFTDDQYGDEVASEDELSLAKGERSGHPSFSGSSTPSDSASLGSVLSESPEATRWQGCGSYFCPLGEVMVDHRPPCPAFLRECEDCGIYVCRDCVQAHPPCYCSYCEQNYRCPNCTRVWVGDGTCRRQAELDAKSAEMERHAADEVARSVGGFFKLVEGHQGLINKSEALSPSQVCGGRSDAAPSE